MKRLRRIAVRVIAFAVLVYVAFLADTVGEATLSMQGEVLASTGSVERRPNGRGWESTDTRQILISIPGKTFWWNGSLPVGTRTNVYVLDGRFTRWRYIWEVAGTPG